MSEQEAQQLMYQMQMLENYFANFTQRENALINVLKDTASAIESIKGISEKKESETLVQVGTGIFVKTKISSNDKIFLNIGAGVSIEKDKDSAINFLESRIKEIEVALNETAAQKQEVALKLEQGKAEMNRMAESVSMAKK